MFQKTYENFQIYIFWPLLSKWKKIITPEPKKNYLRKFALICKEGNTSRKKYFFENKKILTWFFFRSKTEVKFLTSKRSSYWKKAQKLIYRPMYFLLASLESLLISLKSRKLEHLPFCMLASRPKSSEDHISATGGQRKKIFWIFYFLLYPHKYAKNY